MSLLRRRMMMANSHAESGGDWALELHLTPEWEVSFFQESCEIMMDFSTVFNILKNMCQTLGVKYDNLTIGLENIPIECNFTIDGERLTSIVYYIEGPIGIDVIFGDNYCYGVITNNKLSLDK